MTRIAVAALVALAVWAGTAAAELALPRVNFTAEAKACAVIQEKEECGTITIVYTPARWRVDQLTSQSERVTWIFDLAAKSRAEVNFAEKSYTVEEFAPNLVWVDVGFLPGLGIGEAVGPENIGGAPVTKYKIALKDALNFEGFAWLTADNIIVRLQAAVSEPNSDTRYTMSIDVTALTLNAADATQLVIPKDFEKKD